MISAFKGYQLTIEELQKFIDCTKESGYFFKIMHVHGVGEPLVWKHFDKGIKLLKESGIAEKIIVTTNGLLLNKVKEATWEYVDEVHVSVYKDKPNPGIETVFKNKFPNKFIFGSIDEFRAMPQKEYRNKIPGICVCPGPMFVKDTIFLYCGPPLFDAIKVMGMEIFNCRDLYVPVQLNYMATFQTRKLGAMNYCASCFGNQRISMPLYHHGHLPSKINMALSSWYLNEFSDFVAGLKNSIKQNSVFRFLIQKEPGS